jgi:hypothetical protein
MFLRFHKFSVVFYPPIPVRHTHALTRLPPDVAGLQGNAALCLRFHEELQVWGADWPCRDD